MQFEADATGDRPVCVSRLLQVFGDEDLLNSALCADGHRVPNLHQQRLQEVSQPEAFGISVDKGEQSSLCGDNPAFGDGLDVNRQPSSMLLQDVLHPSR